MDVSSSVEGKAVHAALAALGCRAVSVELLQGRETDTLYNSMRPVVASEAEREASKKEKKQEQEENNSFLFVWFVREGKRGPTRARDFFGTAPTRCMERRWGFSIL